MLLAPGQSLSFYEISTPLGAGGMAEVYRAVDTRLQRTVAIKLLSEDVADASARRRFQREAQAASSLNHPNIVTVHDVGEWDGRQYLVLEHVEGGTLREWLRQGARSWREVVTLLVGVADGLAAAHAAGILHRDIKPANILISGTGHAKVADFGLAKLAERAPSAASATELEETQPGVVMGTIAYMSPEQAAGRPLDARSDNFSFGVVLYEALTGRLPFDGETALERLQCIIHEPAHPLEGDFPAELRLVVEKALEKDPAERYQSIREAAVDLRRALRSATGRLAAPASRAERGVRGARSWRPLALGLLGAGAIALAAARWPLRPSAPTPLAPIHQRRLTEMAGMEEMPAVAPDGRTLAFVARRGGVRQIWVRRIGKGEPKALTSAEVDCSFPRWIDDSTLVYYRHPSAGDAAGSLWETQIVSASAPRPLGVAWGEADVDQAGARVATFRDDDAGTALVQFELGGPRSETVVRLSRVDVVAPNWSADGVYSSPRWSPDGRRIAFLVTFDLSNSEIRVIERGAERARTVTRTSQVRGLGWLPDGSGLVYASAEGSTLVYPPIFSLRRVALDGSDDRSLPIAGAGYVSWVDPDLAPDGTLVASRVGLDSDVYRVPVVGTPVENVRNAVRITEQTGQVQVPTASPDGEEVAYLSDSGGHANVWVARVDRSVPPRPITAEDDPDVVIGLPVWSPRGDLIVYYRQRTGEVATLRLIRPDGTGERRLTETAGGASWSRDGNWVYHMSPSGAGRVTRRTERIRVDGGDPLPVRDGAAGILLSSDGRTGYFSPSTARQGEVWRASPVATGVAELLIGDLQSRLPLWPHHYHLSSDDRWLATPLADGGTTNLWIVSTADGSLRRITDYGERAILIGRQVSWSNDDRAIFAAVLEMDADVVQLEGVLP